MIPAYDREALEFARAVTFFDAIFAFSVTLLIASVDDFTVEAWSSPAALWRANGPGLTAFVISFLVVVLFWMANHRLLSGFRALNTRVIGVNVAVMFGIVLIPFTTEALGRATGGEPLAVAVYAVVLVYVSIMQMALVLSADRHRLLHRPLTRDQRRRVVFVGCARPLVFLGSVPVAYGFGAPTAELSWLGLFVVVPLFEQIADRLWGVPSRRIDDATWADLDAPDPSAPGDSRGE